MRNKLLIEFDFILFRMERVRKKNGETEQRKYIAASLLSRPNYRVCKKMAANFYECNGKRRGEKRHVKTISRFSQWNHFLSHSIFYPLVDMSRESSKGNGLLRSLRNMIAISLKATLFDSTFLYLCNKFII